MSVERETRARDSCTHCAAALPIGAVYCPACGRPTFAEEATRQRRSRRRRRSWAARMSSQIRHAPFGVLVIVATVAVLSGLSVGLGCRPSRPQGDIGAGSPAVNGKVVAQHMDPIRDSPVTWTDAWAQTRRR